MSDTDASKKLEGDDQELDELLDSAIADFDKPPGKGAKKKALNEGKSAAQMLPPTDVVNAQESDDKWGEEFLVQVQKQFEQNMKTLLGSEGLEDRGAFDPEQFGVNLQRMAEEANKVLNEQARNPEFTETIAQTLKNLSENAENIDTDIGPNNISEMMEGLGLGAPEVSNEMLPLIQSVMKSFLSKELLYAPIKEITEKYPSWLQEHKDNLDEQDYVSYKKQFQLMEQVCKEFEDEKDEDTEEIKNKRFNKVLGLMEEMQKLGQPPKDLVGEGNPFSLDESALASQLPAGLDPTQCSIM
ncbi:hypothetical protein O3M35_007906 [Rhynocoris fuscipes]|uniref:Peroxin-19 n=1 Tax=Rhynocoris fuscipes TaxID=488301 RepID=A0AAW1DG93_9HEMI